MCGADSPTRYGAPDHPRRPGAQTAGWRRRQGCGRDADVVVRCRQRRRAPYVGQLMSSLSRPSSRARSRTSSGGHSESRCATRLRRPSRERVTDARPDGVSCSSRARASLRSGTRSRRPSRSSSPTLRLVVDLCRLSAAPTSAARTPSRQRGGQLEHADQHRVARGVEVRVHLGGHGLRRRPRPAQEPGDLPLDVVQACRHGRRRWGRRVAAHRRSLPTPPVTAPRKPAGSARRHRANLAGLRAVTSQTWWVCAPPPVLSPAEPSPAGPRRRAAADRRWRTGPLRAGRPPGGRLRRRG